MAAGRRDEAAEFSPTSAEFVVNKPVQSSGSPAGAWLRDVINAAGGTVSWEEFMRRTLYDPAHGYYARRVQTVGREGDFSTAATLHPALGMAVARWAAAHRGEGRGADGRWHLIELGPGNGELAATVLGRLGWWTRRALRYHLVQVSEGLRRAQRERLRPWAGRVAWHGTLAEALSESGGAALIFSNEVVDAFPCARWVRADGTWRELCVAWPEGAAGPAEAVGAVVSDEERGAASVGACDRWPDGQRVEVFLSYRNWMREQLAGWQHGRMLTVDYGDELPALYHRRPAGTLRAYCRQMRFEGAEVYARPGQQDLTADVNFTDLRAWGDELGFTRRFYGTQADFLRRWLSPAAVAGVSRDGRLMAMLDPEGAGGAFKVLEQTRA